MKALDYRNLTTSELHVRLDETRLLHIKVAAAVAEGKEKNGAKLKGLRRDIARIETILQEKSSGQARHVADSRSA